MKVSCGCYVNCGKEVIYPRTPNLKCLFLLDMEVQPETLLLEEIGADTFNPLADLTLPMLASIRRAVRMPLDLYVSLVDAMGGFNRSWEAAEMARVAAPCYFKIEPGVSEAALYKPYVRDDFHQFLVREKVKMAKILVELVQRTNKSIKCAQQGKIG